MKKEQEIYIRVNEEIQEGDFVELLNETIFCHKGVHQIPFFCEIPPLMGWGETQHPSSGFFLKSTKEGQTPYSLHHSTYLRKVKTFLVETERTQFKIGDTAIYLANSPQPPYSIIGVDKERKQLLLKGNKEDDFPTRWVADACYGKVLEEIKPVYGSAIKNYLQENGVRV